MTTTRLLAVLVAAVLVVEMVLVLTGDFFRQAPAPVPLPADASNTADIGRVLYTVYAYPFEIAAMVLLVAMVAAVSLTLRKRKGLKSIPPSEQVAVRREGRVELVKMQSEKDD